MQIGLYSDGLASLSLTECLDFCVDHGVSHMELGTGNWSAAPHVDLPGLLESEGRRDELMAALAARRLALSALNCSGNPLHPSQGEQDSIVVRKTIQLAAMLKVPRVVTMSGCPGGPGDRHPNWITTSWPPETTQILRWQWDERVLPYWREMTPFARDHGVRLCFEMHGAQCVYNVETLERLRDALGDTVGANFDPSHLLWMGADPIAAVRRLGSSIYHAHAKDVRVEAEARENGRLDTKSVTPVAGRSWNFVAVGRGQETPFWASLIQTLRANGYDDVLSIENEDYALAPKEGVEHSISALKQLGVT
jgi:sugar phosphate isomerase/epimerase